VGGYFNVWYVIVQNRGRHIKDGKKRGKDSKESKKVKETEGMAYL